MKLNLSSSSVIFPTCNDSILTHRCSGLYWQNIGRRVLLAIALGLSAMLATGCSSKDNTLTLGRMAELAYLSPDHFARQFKAATGLTPYQFVIKRRVERAQQLLRGRQELSLAEVAISAGFSDQSQLCFHFKRIAGVTPGQFRMSRIA